MQPIIHYTLHLAFPLLIAWVFFRKDFKKAYLIMLATMLVDLDHLLADPVFAANRCSIGYHPLHSLYATAGYFVLLFLRQLFQIIGIGLLFHMLTDLVDCVMTFTHCKTCLADSPVAGVVKWISAVLGL